ncbi:hypothetical protein L596_027596 [Steinernema carpocapsae]|uniref:Uncharacterized protein n=1 Tax=Steinernema carpocapsae TaxID=34508 RepID=A0A4U5LVX5_STECR|nr:hypothetical protein L596_027596 [Steinernema carpocapsae]
MTRMTVYLLFLLIAVLPLFTESAKFCFSGQNNRYTKKQCSTGGDDFEYTCQKFVCEGGRDLFEIRSCAHPNEDPCVGSENLCQMNGGVGSCNVCHEDYCNSATSLALSSVLLLLAIGFSSFLGF